MMFLRWVAAASLVLLSTGAGFSQSNHGEFGVRIQCKVIPEKTAILSTDTLHARCIISRDVGHFYVAVDTHQWDVVGEDGWEIDLKEGEQKEIQFAVKLSVQVFQTFSESMPLMVRISRRPFRQTIAGKSSDDAWGFSELISIQDYRTLNDSARVHRNTHWEGEPKNYKEWYRRWGAFNESKRYRTSVKEFYEFQHLQDSLNAGTQSKISDSVSTHREK